MTWQKPVPLLSTARSKIPKQRSTSQKLQHWRISSRTTGQEKGQAQAQMGGPLHYRSSPDRRSVPSTKCIGQPTRAEPMERNPSPKILRLAPDSEFVSFLRPPFIFSLSFVPLFFPIFLYIVCLTFLSFSPSFLL